MEIKNRIPQLQQVGSRLCSYRLSARQPHGSQWATIPTILRPWRVQSEGRGCQHGLVPRLRCLIWLKQRTLITCRFMPTWCSTTIAEADAQELNPLDDKMYWTLFQPTSKKFVRNWTCFHPGRYEQWDDAVFGDMPDLCHRNPRVYLQLI